MNKVLHKYFLIFALLLYAGSHVNAAGQQSDTLISYLATKVDAVYDASNHQSAVISSQASQGHIHDDRNGWIDDNLIEEEEENERSSSEYDVKCIEHSLESPYSSVYHNSNFSLPKSLQYDNLSHHLISNKRYKLHAVFRI
ncbi:hypothetical protein GCM10027429_12770 [Marivirga atlantica]|uniref:Uncharacterized protein n=1 Tax=Marivirga atlantica TaxID=1548457 RepID=A0A937A777_9BACT|nr:hypothetical protein [Marivirga atlantica]MBL0764890.1 hypothetical protein [Marivirga atlantica]